MADIFMFGIPLWSGIARCHSAPRMPPIPHEIKGTIFNRPFSLGRFKSPEFRSGGWSFFAMIVIVGNKLLMSDLFRDSVSAGTGP